MQPGAITLSIAVAVIAAAALAALISTWGRRRREPDPSARTQNAGAHSQRTSADPLPLIRTAWLTVAAELQQELSHNDPQAHVKATITPTGVLRLDVRTTPEQRLPPLELARRYERRAASLCENCGAHISIAHGGSVLNLVRGGGSSATGAG